MLKSAIKYLQSGLTPLPAIRAKKLPAVASWKPYQTTRPTEPELADLFRNGDGVCLLTGKVSGNLELIDFDFKALFFNEWVKHVKSCRPELYDRLVIERSQSGGLHVIYQCAEPVEGNQKLARKLIKCQTADEIKVDEKTVKPHNKTGVWIATPVMIETRGEGGLFLCCPTAGYGMVQGLITALPIITAEERAFLLQVARSMDEVVEQNQPSAQSVVSIVDTAGRPGSDYNQRGDVRELLRKHGWAFENRVELGEAWRRPGKADGASATLFDDDESLYVFSSNADPLIHQHRHPKFELFARLECGADFTRAASELRKLGYGAEETPVDISGIMAKINAVASIASEPDRFGQINADPGHLDPELLSVPGFIDEVIEYQLVTAPYPNRALAFAGALAMQSFLAGRKVCDPFDIRPNIYILALAETATGKDFPRKTNFKILHEIGKVENSIDAPASGEGLEDALFKSNTLLMMPDEVDSMLRKIKSGDPSQESLQRTLLSIYGESGHLHKMRTKANGDNRVINQPSLTFMGSAIPRNFYESLSSQMLSNGLFGRFLVIEAGARGKGQDVEKRPIPSSIIDTAIHWVNRPYGPGNMAELNPDPAVIPMEPDAKKKIKSLQLKYEDLYDLNHKAGHEAGRALWGRAREYVCKLALLYACSEDVHNPVIRIEGMEWAQAVIEFSIKRMLYMAEMYVSDSQCESDQNYIYRRIVEISKRDEGFAMHYKLKSATRRVGNREFLEAVATLIEIGKIEKGEATTAGRTGMAYRIIQ